MRRLYSILLYLLIPVIIIRLLWRSLHSPFHPSCQGEGAGGGVSSFSYRRIGERFGILPPLSVQGCIWIHAVSVGEVQAAAPLIQHLLSTHPQLPLLITTTTPTGSYRIGELFGTKINHVYAPYDIPIVVRRFLDITQPKLAIFIETEVWPNILYYCQHRNIPTLLANARLSERSARRYARLKTLAQATFHRLTLVIAQTNADAQRLIALGVDSDKLIVTGSIKFDIPLPAGLQEHASVIKRIWGKDRPIWIAASTHEGEDEQILAAHQLVLNSLPSALLVLVPRHPERFAKVGQLVLKQGFNLVRRSENRPCTAQNNVFLGDSMGELPIFFAAAAVAFVGGSLVSHGGHNLLEPAALGVPVITGPYVTNFTYVTEILVAAGAARQVASSTDLAAVVIAWLSDATIRTQIGENGRRVVEQNRGALHKLIGVIESYILRS